MAPTDTPAAVAAPTPVQAQVYTPHEYSADPDWAPHTEDNTSAPCACGSAEGSFIHSVEARASAHTVMALSAGDGGAHSDVGSLAQGGNGGRAVILPGVDTRTGTPLETQEPGTVRSGAIDEPSAGAADQAPGPVPESSE